MNKGFVSIIGLICLSSVLSSASYIVYKNKNAYFAKENHDIRFAEIYAINTVKNDLINYEESNEQLNYLDYEIDLTYDDITCYIKIYDKDNYLKLSSKLVYDDIDEYVVSYEYE